MTDYKMKVEFQDFKDQRILTKIYRVLKKVFPLVIDVELKHISNLIMEELKQDLK